MEKNCRQIQNGCTKWLHSDVRERERERAREREVGRDLGRQGEHGSERMYLLYRASGRWIGW